MRTKSLDVALELLESILKDVSNIETVSYEDRVNKMSAKIKLETLITVCKGGH